MRLSPLFISLVGCIVSTLPINSSGLILPKRNNGRGDLQQRVRCLTSFSKNGFIGYDSCHHRNGAFVVTQSSTTTNKHPTSSALFASPQGKRLWPKNAGNNPIIKAVRRASKQIISFPSRFRTRFSKLSKRGKQLFIIQMLCITMILGSLGRTTYVKYQNNVNGLSRAPAIEVPYHKFMDLVEKSGTDRKSVVVDNMKIGTDKITYRLTKEIDTIPPSKSSSSADAAQSPSTAQIMAYTRKVPASPELIQYLRTNDTPFSAAPIPRTNSLALVARSAIVCFYLLILFRMYKTFTGQMGGGGSNADTPGKLASPLGGNLPLASFQDIQGIDDAKLEVMELVDTLRNPEKYAILGARAPTGLLLEGPPGTGKTMLARATAATAGVPLLYCSGSDFVEMFVGRGASRVRKLFERATKLSPCIIFVDELDALGKARDDPSSFMRSRGNDEAEQTLNQLLACMDGLDSTRRICVLGATNRKEVLDPALIRPGRFDRIVTLRLPNAAGRENILRVHASKLPGFKECSGVDEAGSLGKGDAVDLSAVAAVTNGLSGAELEFIVNESAIRAVRRVSAAIQKGEQNVTPNVLPSDFAESVQNFNDTRRPNKDGVGDLLKNVWK